MLRTKIKTEALKQGLSVYKLSKISGLQITQLNNYLKGKTDLTGENIEKVFKVLKLDVLSCEDYKKWLQDGIKKKLGIYKPKNGEGDLCKMIIDATEKGCNEFRIGTDGTQFMAWPVGVDGVVIDFDIKDNKIITNQKFNHDKEFDNTKQLPTLEEIDIKYPSEVGKEVIMENDMSYNDTIKANYYRKQGAKWLFNKCK